MMFAFPAFQSLVQTLLPLRMGGLGFRESTIGVVQALPGVMALVTGAPLARLANTRWRRRTIAGAFVAGLSAAVALSTAEGLPGMVVPQLLMGLSASAYYSNLMPATFQLVQGQEEQGRIQGYVTTVQGLGFFSGPLLGGYLSESSFASGFLAGAVCAAVGLAVSPFLSPTRDIEDGHCLWQELGASYRRLAQVLARRNAVLVGSGFVFLNIGTLLVMGGSFLLVYAERIGLTQLVASSLISGRELAAAALRLTYPALSRRVRPPVLLGIGTAIGGLSLALIPLSTGVGGLVAVALAISLAIAYMPPAVNMLSGASMALEEQPFAVVSLNIANFAAQTALAPLFGGLLTLVGYGIAYPVIATLWSALALALMVVGLRVTVHRRA